MAVPVLAAATALRYLDKVTVSGNVTGDGGETITSRGFNYGRTEALGTTQTVAGTTGAYSHIFTLTPGTWFFQSFATNADGTTLSATIRVEVYGIVADVRSDVSVVSTVIAAQLAAGYYFQGTTESAMASNTILLFGLTGLGDNRLLGSTGRYRVGAGQQAVGNIFAVKAINANAVYNTGNVASVGNAPADNDIIPVDSVDLWPATTVRIKTGTAYVYGLNVVVTGP